MIGFYWYAMTPEIGAALHLTTDRELIMRVRSLWAARETRWPWTRQDGIVLPDNATKVRPLWAVSLLGVPEDVHLSFMWFRLLNSTDNRRYVICAARHDTYWRPASYNPDPAPHYTRGVWDYTGWYGAIVSLERAFRDEQRGAAESVESHLSGPENVR
jgi:hypothetical protein